MTTNPLKRVYTIRANCVRFSRSNHIVSNCKLQYTCDGNIYIKKISIGSRTTNNIQTSEAPMYYWCKRITASKKQKQQLEFCIFPHFSKKVILVHPLTISILFVISFSETGRGQRQEQSSFGNRRNY